MNALPDFSAIPNGSSLMEDPVQGPGDHRPVARPRWPLLASLALHGLLVLALGIFASIQPIETPPLQSIDVQIVNEPQNAAALQAPAALPAPLEAARPSVEATSPPPTPAPTIAPATPAKEAPGDGMIHPTQLLAQAYVREPASLEIRKNLPKLAPSERVTQLCNIEAGQQIQAVAPQTLVDTVHASSLGDTTIDGLTISAPHAAYRSKRQWYAVSFICTVAPDYGRVTDFSFKVGGPIPRGEWESHYLNLEDENE